MDALDQIAAEAAQHEAEAEAQQPGAEQQAQQVDPAAYWAVIPKMIGGALAMAIPELESVYSDAKCFAWGQSMAAVVAVEGWEASEKLARWTPWLALVGTSAAFVIPTYHAVKRFQAMNEITPEAEKTAGQGGDGGGAQ